VYDLMGLNNTSLAHAGTVKQGPKGHQSFNKDVFYQLSPDLLMPVVRHGFDTNRQHRVHNYYTNQASWDNLIFKNIFNDPAFKKQYSLVLIQNINEPGYSCEAYANNNYLNKLSQQKNFKITIFST